MRPQYLRLFLLVMPWLLFVGQLAHAAAPPRIVPLKATATFSARSARKQWSAPVKVPDGTTA
jgi:hypothetical protein